MSMEVVNDDIPVAPVDVSTFEIQPVFATPAVLILHDSVD